MSAATVEAATMDGASGAHVHRFVPQPEGRLYGKVRYRNRCRCGLRWSPLTREEYLPVGPLCRGCGQPTVATCVDPANPLHPCCAEPRRTR